MIRVRFAPSPTGHLHIGGLRGALFNYIFAKQNNGKFLLRIEDTDLLRSKEEYTQAIIDAFDWCNIKSDEELVYQSKRLKLYQQYIDILLKNDKAYWIEEPNEEGILGKVLKCRVNKENDFIEFNDIIRGIIKFPISEIEDFIIVRSDGMPLYNFVVVVDDIEMQISHIIRGEEHLSNTPKQIILYNAFSSKIPQFAHLPLILGTDGKKLSKRDAATAVIDYKYLGFLPEALCAYLIRLGWSHGDQEIFTFDELYKLFDLSKVHSAGAMFDYNKLLWTNSIFIKKEDNNKLLLLCKSLKNEDLFKKWNDEKICKLINIYKDRSETLIMLIENINKVYTIADNINEELVEINFKNIKEKIEKILIDFIEELNYIEILNSNSLKILFTNISKKNALELNDLFKLIRYALLNEISSPSIYTIIEVLEKEDIINRIKLFLQKFN